MARARASEARGAALCRRAFLRSGGALVVGFSLGGLLPAEGAAQALLPTEGLGKPLDPGEVDSFLALHADGSLTVFTGKVDLGTGLRIAMRQMIAEELDIPTSRIALVEGDTALTPDQGPTAGSSGITRGAVPIRQAAATARQALLQLAAARLNEPIDSLVIENGEVRARSGGPLVEIGALLGGRRLALRVDPKAPRKDPASYRLVGKPLLRPDLPGKCTGRHIFMHDFTVPGMLHGRTIRPPAIGAELLAVDEASIKDVPGARVVRQKNFLAVVAEDEWAAVRAAQTLKARWSEWQGLPGNGELARFVRESPVDHDQVLTSRGDSAARQLKATYFWPVQTHGSMGPSCAVADVRADGATIWTASQATHRFRVAFAKFLGLPQSKVRLVYLDGAGCYGMNGHDDAAADAALISKALGRPVRVQWMRADEHGWDPKGPPQLLELRAGLDEGGGILAWETETWLPAGTKGLPNVPLLAPEAAGLEQQSGISVGLVSQNADPPYAVEHLRVVCHWLKETPLRSANIRAPGKIANSFAVEGFTDELAAAAKADPVAYRLRKLGDPRGIEAIERAAALFRWQPRASPNPARLEGALLIGQGFAYVHYKHNENYVAMAMEVAVARESGRVRVRRVACAHDCGLVVNPDALKNQIEGSIVQTLSRALYEEIAFDRSRVTSLDWASYPILRLDETPEIEIALIDRPTLPPFGGGEASTAPVAAALANAIFDATGARLRTAPLTSERVKAAMLGN
jgi:CO/xanthine dehydrogenase Mo-binding subunit